MKKLTTKTKESKSWQIALALVLGLSSLTSNGQVSLLFDDFDSYADGTQTGSGATPLWTTDASGCTYDAFEVDGKEFLFENIWGTAIWTSKSIDITSYAQIKCTVDVTEKSALNGSDRMYIYYVIDGGTETYFEVNGFLKDDFDAVIATQSLTSGSTLQIVIKVSQNGAKKHIINDVTIEGVTALSLSGTVLHPNCETELIGEVDLTVSGGKSPYSYSWSNGDTAEDPDSLDVGSYTVIVQDSWSLIDSATFTVLGNNLLSASATSTNECDGDGTIDLTPDKGSPPYRYYWTSGDTVQDVSGLYAGTYAGTVIDTTGCRFNLEVTVGHQMSVSVIASDVTTVGGTDGSIDATITGGTTPYSYSWNSGATTEDLDSVFSTEYFITVTDNAGCVIIGDARVDEPLDSNSYIINMGVTPQTMANGLLPYGLVYSLMVNLKMPIYWIIEPSKSKDGIDFTHNSIDYRGGTFVIPGQLLDGEAIDTIAAWEAKGVIGDYSIGSLNLPVYEILTSTPTVVIDDQNDGLITPVFLNAEIPSAAYYIGLPNDLDLCDDVYVLPHADPNWTDHSYLFDYVTVDGGSIWAGCHAISMLEGLVNPNSPYQQMNFLTTSGLQCYSDGKCGYVTEKHDGGSAAPYTHHTSYADDPIMQFMDEMDEASDGGSEKWYIPSSTGSWRATTRRLVTSSDGVSPSEGALLAYGRAFGIENNGMVMYTGGHKMTQGAIEDQVAAQRAFFNYMYLSSAEEGPSIYGTIPSVMTTGSTYGMTSDADFGTPPYDYEWSTTFPGTFTTPTDSATDFVPSYDPATSTPIIYPRVTVRVTDACDRTNIFTRMIEFRNFILPIEMVSFEVDLINETSNLKWITESEIDVLHFEIERRHKAQSNFVKVGLLKPQSGEQTMGRNSYSYYDNLDEMPSGEIYYRVKTVDIDGKVSYSALRQVYLQRMVEPTFEIFPNPSRGLVYIGYQGQFEGDLQFEVYDVTGKLAVSQLTLVNGEQNNKVALDLKDFASGIYFLKVCNNGIPVMQKQFSVIE